MADVQASTNTGDSMVLRDSEVKAFQSRLRGKVLRSGDDGYDEARTVWNGMIDRRPALIACCAGVADVMTTVNFARKYQLLVSMRGGGHNVAGNAVCDGGLMIDLSSMTGIRVDPVARMARVEPGVLWGELDHETQAFGLATTGGFISTTGVAGLTLGGGQGWLASKYGFSIDNLLSVDVVIADGTLLTASATQNEDLFWAMRGAGHNFGVVTSFEYQLHPVSSVLGGMVVHTIDRAADVLRFYRAFTADLPDELTTSVAILTAPIGIRVISIIVCYTGSIDEGQRVLEPLLTFGSPVLNTIAPIPYIKQQTMNDESFPHGRLNYWRSGLTDELNDGVIAALVDYAGRMPSKLSAITIADFHGASRRVGKTEMAYHHRDLRYDILLAANWTDPAETESNMAWTREGYEALQAHLPQGVYVNDLDRDEGLERVMQAYGENYERLAMLKKKYDPTNFFRVNQNIKPAI